MIRKNLPLQALSLALLFAAPAAADVLPAPVVKAEGRGKAAKPAPKLPADQVLAIVNEVYYRNTHKQPDLVEGRRRLDVKIEQLRGEGLGDLKIADYGTRRRFSQAWHEEVLRVLAVRLGTGQRPGIAVHGQNRIAQPGQKTGVAAAAAGQVDHTLAATQPEAAGEAVVRGLDVAAPQIVVAGGHAIVGGREEFVGAR